MYAATKPGILKIVTIVLGLIVTSVGCAAHFNSVIQDLWDIPGASEACDLDPDCPGYAMTMERFFVAINIIFLLLSVASLIDGFLVDSKGLKIPDGAYHVVAGILVFIAGVLMIVAAIMIDDYFLGDLQSGRATSSSSFLKGTAFQGYQGAGGYQFLPTIDAVIKELRKEMKYTDKLAAGAMGMVNGILYFVTAGMVFSS